MQKRHLLWIAIVGAGAGALFWFNAVYGWHSTSDPGDEFGLEFRFVSCDDWPEHRPYEASIASSVNGQSITYQVIDPAGCGYSVRDPRYKLAGYALRLSYDLHTPSGEVAACI